MNTRACLISLLGCSAALGCLTGLTGCASDPSQGYAFSTVFDESINSVAIPILRNETTSRGLEVQLTESLIKELQRRTPWHIAPTDQADTTLVGVITATGLRASSNARGSGLVQEQAVQITMRFEWRDNRTGEILVARDNYSASAIFSPNIKIGDRIETGQRAVIEELAYDIISEMRSGW